MGEMQLNYLLVGNGAYPSGVLVDPSSNVEALVTAIKKANELSAVLSQIQLFLAKQVSGGWIRVDAAEVDALMAGDENSIASMCLSALAPSDALGQHFTPTAFGCRNLHVLVKVREVAKDETHQKTEEEEELVLRCTSAGDPKGSAFSVKINKSDRIGDLQLAVKRLRYEHRVEVHVDSLYLYPTLDWPEDQIEGLKEESKTYRQRWIRQKLDPGRMIGDVFQSIKQDCIHVLVIPPQTFHFAPQQKQEYLLPYQETGRRLKDAIEVVQIVRTVRKYSNIDTTRSNHARLPPFVLLPGSMGVGKTQMAFNLMARDDVEVFYIPCSKLEWAFTDRYDAFDDCVAKDMLELPGCFGDPRKADVATISKQPRMYMYGFIWALVSGVSVFTGPRTRDEVVDALKAWRLKSRGKYCVFFLDNFPCLQHYEYKWWVLKLGLMRNVFRSVGLVVLISADHKSVSDMIEAVVQEHDGDSLWSVVFPTFPRFQDPILSCVRPDLGVIIKKSRPLFAKKALEYMQANPLEDDTDLATYMDNMAGKLVKRDIFKMTTRGQNEFYGAQYSVFFNSSYARTRGGVRIFNYYECLRETKPFKLRIHRGHVVKSKRNRSDWFGVLNCLPLPEEDALFHLSMTGGKNASAFLDCRSNPQASYYEARYFASRCCSLNASSDGAVRQEAEVCGALVVASRHNGFAGSSFPSFFSRLLYEVEMQKSSEVPSSVPE